MCSSIDPSSCDNTCNIIGTMKICDFGLSLPELATQTVEGTPPYMPPEALAAFLRQRSGTEAAFSVEVQQAIDNRKTVGKKFLFAIDVYAMAVIIWEVLTEATMFEHMSTSELAEFVIGGGRCVVTF